MAEVESMPTHNNNLMALDVNETVLLHGTAWQDPQSRAPPKVVRTPSVFNMLTSKCASRHNGVHFFEIWTSKSCPNP